MFLHEKVINAIMAKQLENLQNIKTDFQCS